MKLEHAGKALIGQVQIERQGQAACALAQRDKSGRDRQ
jgi:hypothetical protein